MKNAFESYVTLPEFKHKSPESIHMGALLGFLISGLESYTHKTVKVCSHVPPSSMLNSSNKSPLCASVYPKR